MPKRIKIEILAKDEFWRNAVQLEWAHRHPDKEITILSRRVYSIDIDCLDELTEIALECNSKIVLAPVDPGRRSLFTQFLKREVIDTK